jgi:hypothetical protein
MPNVINISPRQVPGVARALFFDLETRSRIDLKTVGAHRYAEDPSTEVLCVGFAVGDNPVQLWTPGGPVPAEFIEAANNPSWALVAHNAAFERCITQHILAPHHGWPETLLVGPWRCTMAMAYASALPGKLEKVAEALELPHQKDPEGAKLIRLLSKPRADGTWNEDPELLRRLYEYCRQDVEVERDLHRTLPELLPGEQRIWQLDQAINERGFHVDGELLEAANHVVVKGERRLLAEFNQLTGLFSPAQVARLIAWLGAHGCEVPDLQKGTLSHALRRKGLSDEVRRVIGLRQALAHASANKVEALRAWRMSDGRIRGTLIYHGAATGRWVGRGPQPQNFRRSNGATAATIDAVLAGGDGLESPLEAVGDISRAMICAAPGHRLMIADFSGIESRILAWIAGEQDKLATWAKFDETQAERDDPYFIIGRTIGHPAATARAAGKIADLAFGYQGGVGAWQNFAPEDDASSKKAIERYRDAWRAAHPATVEFWDAVNKAAIAAVRQPGVEHKVRQLTFRADQQALRLTLPAGRAIAYPFPRIAINRFDKPCVMFKDSAGGKFVDCAHGRGAYGGLLTENVVSGIARDLLAAALMRLAGAGYPIVLHVHDEVVVEVPDGFGDLDEFKRLVETPPPWAGSLPIRASARASARFSKEDDAPCASSSSSPSNVTAIHNEQHESNRNSSTISTEAMLPVTDSSEDAGIVVTDSAAAEGGFETAELLPAELPPWSKPTVVEVLPGSLEFEQILAELAPEDREIVRPHKPEPRSNGAGARGGLLHCPFHDDGTPSLKIFNDADNPHYHCFGCGAHGPLSDLPDDWAEAASAAHQSNDEAETLAYAHRLWEQAKSIAGTLAERYLGEIRGVDTDALPSDLERSLRFHPRCPFDGDRLPCMLGLFRDLETDEPAGIHCIGLTPEAAKLERRMLGRWPRPRAIKLWPASEQLYLGEGIETVLAAATRLRDHGELMQPAWAAGSSGSIEKFPIVAGVEELTLLVDHGTAGEAGAAACCRAWKAAGRRVRRLRTQDSELNDFNDLVRTKLRASA